MLCRARLVLLALLVMTVKMVLSASVARPAPRVTWASAARRVRQEPPVHVGLQGLPVLLVTLERLAKPEMLAHPVRKDQQVKRVLLDLRARRGTRVPLVLLDPLARTALTVSRALTVTQ